MHFLVYQKAKPNNLWIIIQILVIIKIITMKKIITILAISILLMSCTNKKKYNKNIVNCINTFIKNKDREYMFYKEYYNNIKVLENDLIKSKLLFDRTKESYLKMLDSFEQNPNRFKEFANLEKYFNSSNFPRIFDHFKYCVYKETRKNMNSNYLRSLLLSFDQLVLNGPNVNITKEFIKALDFEHEEFRLLACGYIESTFYAKFHDNKKNP